MNEERLTRLEDLARLERDLGRFNRSVERMIDDAHLLSQRGHHGLAMKMLRSGDQTIKTLMPDHGIRVVWVADRAGDVTWAAVRY